MELNSELNRLQKYSLIDTELRKAKEKHPNWPVDNMYKQVVIINEEVGEVAKAVLHYHDEDGDLQDIKDELIHTTVMCMRMLEALIPL